MFIFKDFTLNLTEVIKNNLNLVKIFKYIIITNIIGEDTVVNEELIY